MANRRTVAPQIDFAALRRECGLQDEFAPAAQREADQIAASPAALPANDRTDIAFVTLDPAGSRDLDQAMCLERRTGGGYRIWYAIADVARFVAPGGALEAATWQRGQTVYLPDGKVPLHPPLLSEGVASLLPQQDRAAVVWTIDLDADGSTTDIRLERARVRSRAQFEYVGVQADLAARRLAEPIALLPEIGELLVARGLARGAISLPSPEQEIEPDGNGWRLLLRQPQRVEEYNAQISLLTGMSAAQLMLDGRVGLLRTMPAPAPEAIAALRIAAGTLGITWPAGASVGEVVAGVDVGDPRAAAFVDHAAELMRGAGYTAFDGAPPAQPEHGAVASTYAHVTAPLRRLADRYATEVCLALFAGAEVPDWARTALPRLPAVMASTDRIASAASRGAVDLTEAVLLSGRVGTEFDAAVIDLDNPPRGTAGSGRRRPAGGMVALDDPPVRARCEGADLPLGQRVRVRLAVADPDKRLVLFTYQADGG